MKNFQRNLNVIMIIVLTFFILFPVIYMLINAFASPDDIYLSYIARLEGGRGKFFPSKLSIDSWIHVFWNTPEYLWKFWKSMGLCIVIAVGHIVISCTGGFAFSKYAFKGKAILYFIMIVLMMMPIQVSLVPDYIIFERFHLIGTWWALILPAIFHPFGTVFLTQIMKLVPDELIEAARLEGAKVSEILISLIVPMCKGGIISVGILSFIDAWNMVEQPMIFLNSTSQYPLSVFLAVMNELNYGESFVCGVLALLPVTLLFLYFREELLESLEFVGLK